MREITNLIEKNKLITLLINLNNLYIDSLQKFYNLLNIINENKLNKIFNTSSTKTIQLLNKEIDLMIIKSDCNIKKMITNTFDFDIIKNFISYKNKRFIDVAKEIITKDEKYISIIGKTIVNPNLFKLDIEALKLILAKSPTKNSEKTKNLLISQKEVRELMPQEAPLLKLCLEPMLINQEIEHFWQMLN